MLSQANFSDIVAILKSGYSTSIFGRVGAVAIRGLRHRIPTRPASGLHGFVGREPLLPDLVAFRPA
jgi:hypothetical protein